MCFPEFQPFIELIVGDRKTFTECFDRSQAGEKLSQDTQKEEQTVTGIRDDKIRKDSVGMPAATDQTQNADVSPKWSSLNKINNLASVISMDAAVSLGTAEGAGFQFRAE